MLEEEEDEGCRGFHRILSAETLLSHVQELTPLVIQKSKESKCFLGRWKAITSRLHQVPDCVSDLSTHPLFYKSSLCMEQLQSIFTTLEETIHISELCSTHNYEGKLQMQSDLDSLSAKLDLNLHDCFLLMKTGVLGDASSNLPSPSSSDKEAYTRRGTRDLLAKLQIGHMESKNTTLDRLTEAIKTDENSIVTSLLRRRHISSLVHLLTTATPNIRDKAITFISSLTDSPELNKWLLSEGALPPLLRLLDSGSSSTKRKACIALQKLSSAPDTARSIISHGGARPLIQLCDSIDITTQFAASYTLKNISSLPETRHTLVEQGLAKAMVRLLNATTTTTCLNSATNAVECLYHLTMGADSMRRRVVAEGGVQSLLKYIDCKVEKEAALRAVGNLMGVVTVQYMVSEGLIPRLGEAFRNGSEGAKKAAAGAICGVCWTGEMKRMVGEEGCVGVLVGMLEKKGSREVGVQALWVLMTVEENRREVKRDGRSVGSLVRMMKMMEEEEVGERRGSKYAVGCLVMLSSCRRCRKEMIANGAIGCLKKLGEMEVPGARMLQEKLERGRFSRMLFRRK